MIGTAISGEKHRTCPSPSLAASKRLLSDLFVPRPVVYWADFLSTIGM